MMAWEPVTEWEVWLARTVVRGAGWGKEKSVIWTWADGDQVGAEDGGGVEAGDSEGAGNGTGEGAEDGALVVGSAAAGDGASVRFIKSNLKKKNFK